MTKTAPWCLVLVLGFSHADAHLQPPTELAAQLRQLDTNVVVLGSVRQAPLAGMIARDVAARLRQANRSDTDAWRGIRSRDDWERHRAARIDALRRSLGPFPEVPRDLRLEVVGTHRGEGFEVRNVVYEARPGWLVTANLYLPERPARSLPAIVLCHSHQQPKHTEARQDMAMTWARAGCVVLVPDHLGHGERRQHPFSEAVPHDYHFRYDAGIQLHLVGESLMGWLVWDLLRGVDLLLARGDVDPERVVLISEPAGGGDVAAVAAALDPRIRGVMVQNFGGPEPETPYPLPLDAAESFDYVGSGSWESTRNLRLSARDGFLPWTIVAAIAPRRVIYDHEFYWDRDQDPVWPRLQQVWQWYSANEALVGIGGHGFVVGSAPENTHWLPENRELLYPVLDRWFQVPNPGREYSRRLPAEQLLCLTPELRARRASKPLHQAARELAAERTSAARARRDALAPAERCAALQSEWSRWLGRTEPAAPRLQRRVVDPQKLSGAWVERLHLGTDPGIVVPALLLRPDARGGERVSLVVGFAQEGKQAFLRQRSEAVALLLQGGTAVCLIDVRGTGESAPDDDRGRRGAATALSSSEWMLGDSLLAGRLRDLRAVLEHLRERPDLDARRVALWGESFASVNAPDADFHVPYTATQRPHLSEPLGGLLALLGALFEEDVAAVYGHGGLGSFQSVLEAPLCYVPHDVIVPGVLAEGDLSDLAAALAPRPLRLTGLVDGRNRRMPAAEIAAEYRRASDAYAAAGATAKLRVSQERSQDEELVRHLQAVPATSD